MGRNKLRTRSFDTSGQCFTRSLQYHCQTLMGYGKDPLSYLNIAHFDNSFNKYLYGISHRP